MLSFLQQNFSLISLECSMNVRIFQTSQSDCNVQPSREPLTSVFMYKDS